MSANLPPHNPPTPPGLPELPPNSLYYTRLLVGKDPADHPPFTLDELLSLPRKGLRAKAHLCVNANNYAARYRGQRLLPPHPSGQIWIRYVYRLFYTGAN